MKNEHRPKIAIIDDNPEKEALEHFLGEYDLVFETNAGNAIQTISTEKPDLILLDWKMPKLTGFDIAEEIRSIPELKNLAIIFTTFSNDVEKETKAYRDYQAADWIIKPFYLEALTLTVKRHLELDLLKREGSFLQHNSTVLAVDCNEEEFINQLPFKIIPAIDNESAVTESLAANSPAIALVYAEVSDMTLSILKKYSQSKALIIVGIVRTHKVGSIEGKILSLLERGAHTVFSSNIGHQLIKEKLTSLTSVDNY